MRLFLKLFSYLLTPFIYILVKKRVYKGLDDPIRYKERFGITNVSPKKNAEVIWFHAASIGESVSILPILNEWGIQRPQDQILVTTVTKTSAKIMQDRMPKGCIHQYVPFDLTHWVCRFLNHWRPKKLIVVESEFWLNMILESHNRGIKIFNINGKLSDASFKFWTKYRFLARNIFPKFSYIFAQSTTDKTRYLAVGAKNVEVLPNLKYAASPLPLHEENLKQLKQTCSDRKIWVIASTHAGEEKIICDWHHKLKGQHPNLLTIIIPRHTERSNAIVQLIVAHNLKATTRSQNSTISKNTDIYVVDTLGEVGLFYALSPLVLIGGTLVDGIGGHNPIEPGLLGCNVILGPYSYKLTQIKENLHDALSCGQNLDDTFKLVENALSHNQRHNSKLKKNIGQYGQTVLSSIMKKIV